MVANELVEDYKRCWRKGLLIKLGVRKAFERVGIFFSFSFPFFFLEIDSCLKGTGMAWGESNLGPYRDILRSTLFSARDHFSKLKT